MSIERYFSPDLTLAAKQGNEEGFRAYLEANPQMVPSLHVKQESAGAEGEEQSEQPVIDEEKVA